MKHHQFFLKFYFFFIFITISISAIAMIPKKLVLENVMLWNDETRSYQLSNVYLHQNTNEIVEIEKLTDQDIPQHPKYILPGFINAHVHLVNTDGCQPGYDFKLTTFIDNVNILSHQGFMTMADMAGWPSFIDAMRGWINENKNPYPQILMAGPVLTVKEGYPHNWLPAMSEIVGAVDFIDDQSSQLQLIQKLKKFGVNYLKIGLQERSFSGKELPILAKQQLAEFIELAKENNLKVFVHALTEYGYQLGLELKVSAFIHGPIDLLSDDLIEKISKAKIPVIPTIWVWKSTWYVPEKMPTYPDSFKVNNSDSMNKNWDDYLVDYQNSGQYFPAYILHENQIKKSDLKQYHENLVNNLQRMKKAKIDFAFGTDAPFCFNTIGSSQQELIELKSIGFTDEELILMMTKNSALLLGIDQKEVDLKVGSKANFLIYHQKPTIDHLLTPDEIYLKGEKLASKIEVSFWDRLEIIWIFIKSFFKSLFA